MSIITDREDAEPFTLCEKTVRACIEALPQALSWQTAQQHDGQVIDALEALLPTPDRAKELADEYLAAAALGEVQLDCGRMTSYAFARWLIQTGRLK